MSQRNVAAARRLYEARNRREVVALLNTRARGRESGAELDVPVAHVLLFRDGKCVRYVSYMDRAEGLAAAGVRPR